LAGKPSCGKNHLVFEQSCDMSALLNLRSMMVVKIDAQLEITQYNVKRLLFHIFNSYVSCMFQNNDRGGYGTMYNRKWRGRMYGNRDRSAHFLVKCRRFLSTFYSQTIKDPKNTVFDIVPINIRLLCPPSAHRRLSSCVPSATASSRFPSPCSVSLDFFCTMTVYVYRVNIYSV
jgi:hypothetical protein